jgi:hypothetical protein
MENNYKMQKKFYRKPQNVYNYLLKKKNCHIFPVFAKFSHCAKFGQNLILWEDWNQIFTKIAQYALCVG